MDHVLWILFGSLELIFGSDLAERSYIARRRLTRLTAKPYVTVEKPHAAFANDNGPLFNVACTGSASGKT